MEALRRIRDELYELVQTCPDSDRMTRLGAIHAEVVSLLHAEDQMVVDSPKGLRFSCVIRVEQVTVSNVGYSMFTALVPPGDNSFQYPHRKTSEGYIALEAFADAMRRWQPDVVTWNRKRFDKCPKITNWRWPA